ncbi:hypothetical protein P9112_005489 [Eukaryota sp. TZLM1-RC]
MLDNQTSPFDFKGQVAVVTGASSGIGVQMSMALARQGADVALLARRVEKLETVAKEIRKLGVKCVPVKCDVTDTEAVKAAVETVKTELGRCDVLINNAGGNKGGASAEFSDEDWNFVVELNLTSVFKVSREFGKLMIEQNYGRIINIASMYGIVGSGLDCTAYHATKAAVNNMTRSMAAEWAKHGITVNALCPGFFISELTEELLTTESFQAWLKTVCPMNRHGEPGELDTATLFLAAKGSSYCTGVILPIDGGYTCV